MATNTITKLGIINNALLLLRLPTVQNPQREKYARTADSIYDEVLLEALTLQPWRWATVARDLIKKQGTPITTTTLVNGEPRTTTVGYQNVISNYNTGGYVYYNDNNYIVYDFPNGMIRPVGIWFKSGNEQVQYFVDGDGIHAPDDELIIRYTVQLSEDKFPPTFARLVEASLAMRLAPLHDNANIEFIQMTYDRAKRNAAIVDESSVGGKRQLFKLDQYILPRLYAHGGNTDILREFI